MDSQLLKASGVATKILKNLDDVDYHTKLAILAFVKSLILNSAGAEFSTNDPGDEAELKYL